MPSLVLIAQNEALTSAAKEAEEREAALEREVSRLNAIASTSERKEQPQREEMKQQGQDTSTTARGRWEAEKKLRRRVEVLQSKLNSKQQEVDTLTSKITDLEARNSELLNEVDQLKMRVASVNKRRADAENAVVNAVAELEPVAVVKDRLFAAEENLLQTQRDLENVRAELRTVIHQREALTTRTSQAEEEAAELRKRLRDVLPGGRGTHVRWKVTQQEVQF